MLKRSRFLVLAAALSLAACGNIPQTSSSGPIVTASPTAPAFSSAEAGQAMITARLGYNAAVTAATAYAKLPACTATQHAPCHDPALLAQLAKADRTAFNALDAADSILRQPALGSLARNSAIAAAQAALAAFSTLTGGTK